jgi:hypothetical protein
MVSGAIVIVKKIIHSGSGSRIQGVKKHRIRIRNTVTLDSSVVWKSHLVHTYFQVPLQRMYFGIQSTDKTSMLSPGKLQSPEAKLFCEEGFIFRQKFKQSVF